MVVAVVGAAVAAPNPVKLNPLAPVFRPDDPNVEPAWRPVPNDGRTVAVVVFAAPNEKPLTPEVDLAAADWLSADSSGVLLGCEAKPLNPTEGVFAVLAPPKLNPVLVLAAGVVPNWSDEEVLAPKGFIPENPVVPVGVAPKASPVLGVLLPNENPVDVPVVGCFWAPNWKALAAAILIECDMTLNEKTWNPLWTRHQSSLTHPAALWEGASRIQYGAWLGNVRSLSCQKHQRKAQEVARKRSRSANRLPKWTRARHWRLVQLASIQRLPSELKPVTFCIESFPLY